jgi:hypothetical protein
LENPLVVALALNQHLLQFFPLITRLLSELVAPITPWGKIQFLTPLLPLVAVVVVATQQRQDNLVVLVVVVVALKVARPFLVEPAQPTKGLLVEMVLETAPMAMLLVAVVALVKLV